MTRPSAVVYRSTRGLAGLGCDRNLSGLAGSSKKRNWDAFNSAFPGTTVNSAGNYVLPAKFGGVVINQGQLDELDGTWYGATFHPDGDQIGWQQKFDATLKNIGAFNAYYGATAPAPTPTPTPLPPPIVSAPPPPTGLIPPPVLVAPLPSAPAPTPLPVITTPPGGAITAPTVPPDQTAALIQQLMAQGASQQQAYAAALQSLAAQGVQATPQVQQQVANDVAAASTPQQASTLWLAGGAVLIIGLGILMSRRNKRR
jgi:hypothetical protein